MSNAAIDPDRTGWYEIRLEGRLDARWAARFDGMSLTVDDGCTLLAGHLVDQAALHGVLQRLRDIGLPLVSVCRVRPPAESTSAPQPCHHEHRSLT
jgi:hypothetical protein